MTKIGLLSDTHGYLNPKIFKHFAEVDEIWHAGDIGSLSVVDELRAFKPTRIVYGNIDDADIQKETDLELTFWVEQVKVCMTHIAGRPGKYVPAARNLAFTEQPQIFVCGHSHILLAKKDPFFKHLHLNPGACGKKGFHAISTLMRFEIDGKNIQKMEVIELGNRVE